MVKKVGGSKTGRTTATTPVQATRTVESAKIGSVEQVKQAEQKSAVGKASRQTRLLTAEDRARIFQIIDEEAEKMFSAEGLPKSKKETIKGAVRMALEAGILDEDEKENS